ncbi:MAG: ABC transporter permease [Myxococcota bacterium]|nr:ABC transporter permease [Myxococcota bacterium]
MSAIPAWVLLLLLALPVVGLVFATSPSDLAHALSLDSTRSALWLSMGTTTLALFLVVVLGTPLAWRLSRKRDSPSRWVMLVVELPVVLPPTVLGIALLETFGRQGLLGPGLAAFGMSVPFTTTAVILAQVMVGAPLYVLTATAGFRAVDDDLILVARTLGASPSRAFLSVAIPAAGASLVSGAGLAWARALGEFGATLMFAGNLPGKTQTLTLAVFQALEQDLAQARAIALILVCVAVLLLLLLRAFGPRSSS